MRRQEMLDELAERIASLHPDGRVRVAIDGIDAAGKTTLADELALAVERRGRPVIRTSIDGFHRPRAERYRRGEASPEGYYLDSFDYPAVREALLLPLGPDGSGRYRRAVFDFRADSPLLSPEEVAPAGAALIMDGVFLLRPELDALWDYQIFVEVSFEVALERARRRDVALFGSAGATEARYRERYIPGQRLYFAAARPQERADVVVRNGDVAQPRLVYREQAGS